MIRTLTRRVPITLAAAGLCVGAAVATAPAAQADGWDHVGERVLVIQGENARVEFYYHLWRYLEGPANCTPNGTTCVITAYGWKLSHDRKWNPPGGASTVAFQSITGAGTRMGWATMPNGATHCWFPDPPYPNAQPSSCAPNTSKSTAWNGGPWTTAYKVTVTNVATGSSSCYAANATGSTQITNGACP